MLAKHTHSCLNCAISTYYIIKSKITTFIQLRKKKHDFFSVNLFNSEEEQPAIILSSEEISNMITKQSQYSESNPNVNEYKIIKDKDKGDNDESNEAKLNEQKMKEIKTEISDFEFEDDDQEKNLKPESIEELKSSVLNSNTEG